MTDNSGPDNAPEVSPDGFRASPNGHLYGIIDDPATDIPGLTADLLAARIPIDGIHIYCCAEGADALDLTGTKRRLRAHVSRILNSVAYEPDHLVNIEDELLAGHALVGVAADDDRKGDVAQVLHAGGARDIVYYGALTWQRLGPRRHQNPT